MGETGDVITSAYLTGPVWVIAPAFKPRNHRVKARAHRAVKPPPWSSSASRHARRANLPQRASADGQSRGVIRPRMRATRQPVRLVAPDQEHAIARAASLHGKPLRGARLVRTGTALWPRVHVARPTIWSEHRAGRTQTSPCGGVNSLGQRTSVPDKLSYELSYE